MSQDRNKPTDAEGRAIVAERERRPGGDGHVGGREREVGQGDGRA